MSSRMNKRTFSCQNDAWGVKDPVHPIFKLNTEDKKYREDGVVAFWDFENTHARGAYELLELRDHINSALKKSDGKNYFVMKFIGFGNVGVFADGERKLFKKCGLRITDVPRRESFCTSCADKQGKPGRKKDPADSLIIQSMILHALDMGSPGNILVISGDVDFATPITSLTLRGFRTFVALRGDSNTKLQNSGNVTYLWDDREEYNADRSMYEGGDPIII